LRPAALQEARDAALQEYAILERRIPRLGIILLGAWRENGRVTIDGKPVSMDALAHPVRVDPGTHEIVAEVVGAWAVRHRVVLPERAGTHVEWLALPATPAAGSADEGGAGWFIGPFVLLGLGGTALTTSLGLAVAGGGPGDETVFDVAIGTFVVGGLLSIGSAGWFMGHAAQGGSYPTSPPPTRSIVRIEPMVGPGRVGLGGRF